MNEDNGTVSRQIIKDKLSILHLMFNKDVVFNEMLNKKQLIIEDTVNQINQYGNSQIAQLEQELNEFVKQINNDFNEISKPLTTLEVVNFARNKLAYKVLDTVLQKVYDLMPEVTREKISSFPNFNIDNETLKSIKDKLLLLDEDIKSNVFIPKDINAGLVFADYLKSYIKCIKSKGTSFLDFVDKKIIFETKLKTFEEHSMAGKNVVDLVSMHTLLSFTYDGLSKGKLVSKWVKEAKKFVDQDALNQIVSDYNNNQKAKEDNVEVKLNMKKAETKQMIENIKSKQTTFLKIINDNDLKFRKTLKEFKKNYINPKPEFYKVLKETKPSTPLKQADEITASIKADFRKDLAELNDLANKSNATISKIKPLK